MLDTDRFLKILLNGVTAEKEKIVHKEKRKQEFNDKGLKLKRQDPWISQNKVSLDATLNISLRRRLHKISDSEQPFKSPFHWAAFCAICKSNYE